MIDKSAKRITRQRVIELFDCYGGSPQTWPKEERTSALALLEGSSELKALRAQALILDEAMRLPGNTARATTMPGITHSLAIRILNKLPAQESPRLSDQQDAISRPTLVKRIQFWSSLALSGAVAAALVIILLSPQPVVETHYRPLIAANDFDDWVWEEVLDQGQEDSADRWDIDDVTLLTPELLSDDF